MFFKSVKLIFILSEKQCSSSMVSMSAYVSQCPVAKLFLGFGKAEEDSTFLR